MPKYACSHCDKLFDVTEGEVFEHGAFYTLNKNGERNIVQWVCRGEMRPMNYHQTGINKDSWPENYKVKNEVRRKASGP